MVFMCVYVHAHARSHMCDVYVLYSHMQNTISSKKQNPIIW